MSTIRLDVEREWQVTAVSFDSTGKDDERGGNLDLLGGSKVVWQADSSPGWIKEFEITFWDSAKPTERIWPFTDAEPSDRILVVPRGDSRTLTTASGDQRIIKYDARVKLKRTLGGPETAKPLDPMIIVRPHYVAAASHHATDTVMFGVTCAVLGAAVGALLTALTVR